MVAIISVASWEHAVALARLWLVRGCVHLHHPAWQRWLTLGACARLVHLCPGARFSMARRGRGEESEWPQKGSAPLTLCHIVIRKSPRTGAQTKPVGSSTVLHLLSVVSPQCTLCTKFTVKKINRHYISIPHPSQDRNVCEGRLYLELECVLFLCGRLHSMPPLLRPAFLRSIAICSRHEAIRCSRSDRPWRRRASIHNTNHQHRRTLARDRDPNSRPHLEKVRMKRVLKSTLMSLIYIKLVAILNKQICVLYSWVQMFASPMVSGWKMEMYPYFISKRSLALYHFSLISFSKISIQRKIIHT